MITTTTLGVAGALQNSGRSGGPGGSGDPPPVGPGAPPVAPVAGAKPMFALTPALLLNNWLNFTNLGSLKLFY